ncbi:MAG: DUF4423 domain-containing protein [Bdellovibrionaceae bacterium]|nr:DUF4423 domain-containing protein [Pseudobdellovibrionaceae bacterium]
MSALSEALRGRVLMKPEKAAQYVAKFGFEQRRKDLLFALMNLPASTMKSRFVDRQRHPLLGDWAHAAVLHFFELDVQDKSAQAIAARLHLSFERVQEILQNLSQEGLLPKEGEIPPRPPSVEPPSYPEAALQDRANIDMILKRMQGPEQNAPFMTATTFTGSRQQFEMVIQEIQLLHGKAAALSSQGQQRERIYRLSVSLLPVDFTDKE